jgi:hypothetical protein
LERCAEIPQEAGRIQFEPVDLVWIEPSSLDHSRVRNFNAENTVFELKTACSRPETAVSSKI